MMNKSRVRHLMPGASDAVVAFAAAAYDYFNEKTTPAPDGAMLYITWNRLIEADKALTVEDRQFLAAQAGR